MNLSYQITYPYQSNVVLGQDLQGIFLHQGCTLRPISIALLKDDGIPKPSDYKKDSSRRGREAILKLYNQKFSKKQRKLTQKVKEWFLAELKARGWGRVEFITNKSGGSVCNFSKQA